MIVISDTSVISNLVQLGDEDLLPQIFGQVIIPHGVYRELEEIKSKIDRLSWLEVKELGDDTLFKQLLLKLDSGESEAIALAKELNANLLLIDEKRGRRVARAQGLNIIGLLGVLLEAKALGLIDRIKPRLDRLVFEIDFRVHPSLYQQTLVIAEEE